MTLDRLRDALEALGSPVTPLELAEMLWLAERLPVGDGGGAGASTSVSYGGDHVDFRTGTFHFHGPVTGSLAYAEGSVRAEEGDADAERLDPAEAEGDAGPRPDPGRRALHVPRGAPRPGTDADDVLVPAPQALRHELAIQRALRPLKRRVPDRRRRTLDEEATAARAARRSGLRPWAPVMVPVTGRLLSLALVVDTGPAMTVWRPLARELREAMQRTGAFRDVRVWRLADIGSRVGVRISAGGPALDPAALVDPTGRQIVLVLSDCSGPHWWAGHADPALHLWAGRGPTAILQPLPERLWRRTAAPAVPGRAIASRAGAPNTALRFTPHDGRAGLPAPDAIPVPVLELAPEWLADWAGLVTASGDQRRDTAVTYVSRAHPPHAQPVASEGELPVTERILRFQTAASPTAADLAAHVALSVPALPVMRLIQQRVTPGSRPSDLAEVLLSGLLEPVDAERGLYDFVPGARAALLETLPRPESLAVAELLGRLGAEIEARAGSGTRAFRAVVWVGEGAGSRGLGEAGQPFALVSEEALGMLRGRAIRVVERPVGAFPQSAAGTDTDTVGLGPTLEELASPRSVTAPAGLSNLPVEDHFVGRVHELDGLDRTFTDLHGAERVVLHGAAGVGKTALARAWASRWGARGQEPLVWWVTADSPASLVQGLSRLTGALQPFVRDPRAQGGRWEWALQWLSSHTGWALVLDGVESPDDVRVLLSRLGTRGVVLITSREAEGWPDDVFRLALDVPGLSETVQMFKVRAGREVAGVVRLCEELGRLPGAVVRAAETIAETGVTVDEYLSGAVGEASASLVEGPAPTGAPVEGPAVGDGDAIRESLRTLHDPTTLQLLMTLAWMGTAPVPLEVLVTGLSSMRDVPSGLADLAERGLTRPGPEADQVVLPELVGTVARTPDESLPYRSQGAIDAARDWAVVCLGRSFPQPADEPMHWTRCRLLLPLVEGLCARSAPERDTEPVAGLLVDAARFLVSQGEFERAIGMLHRALSCRRRLEEGQSREVVATMEALARAHLAAGRATEAIQLFKDAQRALGSRWTWRSGGLDALELRAGLGDAYAESGDPIRAVRELEAAYTEAAEVLGPRHPGRLRLWSRLAGMYARAGRLADAVAHYEDLLAVCRGALGSDDLETIAVQRDLALAHGAAGHADRAVAELKQVVDSLARILGSGHPRTAAAQSDLAGVYRGGGMVKPAADMYERALAASRSTLGAEHPQTLDVRERLADTFLTHRSAARAVPLFEEVLSVRGALFGEGHPDTLRVADSLAAAYGTVGRRDLQVALYERTLAIRRELLGDGDPETLRSYVRLATITGADDTSIETQARAHAGRVRTLGEDHPDTLLTLEWLALARIKAGDTDLGLQQLGHALILWRDTQGPTHADTLRAVGHLAQAQLDRGEVGQALEAYEKVSGHAQHTRGDIPAAITVLERAHTHLTSAMGPTHAAVKALETRLARLR